MKKETPKLLLQLKSGRYVKFVLPDASHGMKIGKLLPKDASEDFSLDAKISATYARVALMIASFTLPDINGEHDPDKMDIREKLKNNTDLERFWSRFTEQEYVELQKYADELTSDELPESKEDVDKAVDGAINKKK